MGRRGVNTLECISNDPPRNNLRRIDLEAREQFMTLADWFICNSMAQQLRLNIPLPWEIWQ